MWTFEIVDQCRWLLNCHILDKLRFAERFFSPTTSHQRGVGGTPFQNKVNPSEKYQTTDALSPPEKAQRRRAGTGLERDKIMACYTVD